MTVMRYQIILAVRLSGITLLIAKIKKQDNGIILMIQEFPQFLGTEI